MIFFKKNTPILKDLIPIDYVDIHSHLLPGIDDGAKSIEETLILISKLKEIGCTKIITTPHIIKDVWNNSFESITEKHKEISVVLTTKNETIPFKAAAEYMIDNHFFDLIKTNQKLLTLKDNIVLVEMSYLHPPLQLYDILFELQVSGYQPLLAHPERYSAFHFNLNEYKKLKNAGCKFQLNLLSSVGYYGPNEAKTADYLIKNNMIDYVGSDVHHLKHISFFDKKIVLKDTENFVNAIQNNSFFGF